MNFKSLLKYSGVPILYEKGTANMWQDSHISKELLKMHLKNDLDLASRKDSSIKKTTNWILHQTENKPNLDILDLGCGPGLYAELFAQKGHKVTAVDFSKSSIDYAKNEAKKKLLNISYINSDYLSLDFGTNKYDLIIMIYTDFGVLLPGERDSLLVKIRKSLKDGGIFIFDVLSDKKIKKKTNPKEWEISKRGFWKSSPYLSISNSFLYEAEKVILYQHIIMDQNDNVDLYRFWTHFFSQADLKNLLLKNELRNISFNDSVLPQKDIWSGDNVIFCTARI